MTPLYNIYFCYITNKVVSELPKFHEKVFFWAYFIFSSISHWNSYCDSKFLHSPGKIGLERKQKLFWHHTGMENNLGTWPSPKVHCRTLIITLLSRVTWHLSPVTNFTTDTTATAKDPPHASFPNMHSRLVHQGRTKTETK